MVQLMICWEHFKLFNPGINPDNKQCDYVLNYCFGWDVRVLQLHNNDDKKCNNILFSYLWTRKPAITDPTSVQKS